MSFLLNYIKGIIVGIGGIAPGLSGSVMLLILGLYERAINTISTIFNFKKMKTNLAFLIPLALGLLTGVVIFSKIVDFFLENYELATRYLFFGLVIGTVPLFFKEVRKKGFGKKYCFIIIAAAVAGVAFFAFNEGIFPKVENPTLIQSVMLGVAVAGSSIVPGVDSAVILSTLGLYKLYVSSIADFNLQILLPAGLGVIIGVIVISLIMNFLIKRFYTVTFSLIFGLFLSIIPRVLNESCRIVSFGSAVLAVALVVLGFCVSFYLGDIKTNNERIKKIFKRETN